MSFIPIAVRRYHILKDAGFIEYEACQLCVFPLHHAFMRRKLKRREAEYQDALKHGVTAKEWENRILARNLGVRGAHMFEFV